jgi:sugar-specific transcriptional regulator TrmB
VALDDTILRLTHLGLSEWEAKAYLALLRRNPANGYQVSKESSVPRSMVYEVLAKLVSRGAVVRTHEADTALYAPVPPFELIERLQREHEQLTESLKSDLRAVSHTDEEEYVWHIEGRANILARAQVLIDESQRTLSAQVARQEIDDVRRALEAAAARGVAVAVVCDGPLHLKGAREVVVPPLMLPGEANPFEIILVRDQAEMLVGDLRGGERESGSWTRNRQLALMAEGHIRRSLILPAMYRALGAQGVEALMNGDEQGMLRAVGGLAPKG